MVSARVSNCRYAIDGENVLAAVSPGWLAFAAENGASELKEETVIGRPLWDFIDGQETVALYQEIFHRIRSGTDIVVLPFRCDSPTLRRYMRLVIVGKPEGWIQLDGILEWVEPTRRLNVLDPDVSRSVQTLAVCSCCRRAFVEPHGWVEIEEASVRLHLFENAECPELRNTVCPKCTTDAQSA